jgi:hypothetical protein
VKWGLGDANSRSEIWKRHKHPKRSLCALRRLNHNPRAFVLPELLCSDYSCARTHEGTTP